MFPWHQETPAGVLHMWWVTNRMWAACDWHGLLNYVKTNLLILSSVPRYLLEDVGRGSTDPFMISDYTHGESKTLRFTGFVACSRLWLASEPRPLSPAGGWYTGPTYRPQNVLTNSLEIIEKILGMCTDAWKAQARVACTFPVIVVDHQDHIGVLASSSTKLTQTRWQNWLPRWFRSSTCKNSVEPLN